MNAIFAINAINGFAVNNTMPWDRNKFDLQRFKKYTVNNTVIMGRGTWDSDMPKPLPNRRNIVLSKTLKDDRCEVYDSINELLYHTSVKESIWVIGGVQVLLNLRPHIKNIYLTQFYSSNKSDIILDIDEYLKDFELLDKEIYSDHTFKIYRRI